MYLKFNDFNFVSLTWKQVSTSERQQGTQTSMATPALVKNAW